MFPIAYGSDKPDDKRYVSLLRSPGFPQLAMLTSNAGLGSPRVCLWSASHGGDWRSEQTDWQAQRLNQPLIAFESSKHPGTLGKSFSMLRVNNNRVRVLALKKAEESDEIIVRIVELDGRGTPDVRLSFAAPVVSAREVTGQELPLVSATVTKGQLVTKLGGTAHCSGWHYPRRSQ